MADIVPAEVMAGGRVVARFQTRSSEIFATGTPFHPAPPLAGAWAKPLLFAAGLVIGVIIAFGGDILPVWPWWLNWVLPGVVVGFFLSTLFWLRMGKRSQKEMAKLARIDESQDVTVTCHASGLSWATASVIHYIAYGGIDQVVEQGGTVLIRYKLFVVYVPDRGFATPEDKAHLLDALRATVAPEKLAGLAANA